MGTSLTGLEIRDTYDSLIKVTDNGPLSGTAKYLSDGLGNDSVLAVSTSRVGIGTTSPDTALDVNGGSKFRGSISGFTGAEILLNGGNNSQVALSTNGTGSTEMYLDHRGSSTGIWKFRDTTDIRMSIIGGNVGIGTSSPDTKLQVAGTGATGLSIRANTSGDAFMRYYLDGVIASDAYVDRATGVLNIRSNQNGSAIAFSTSAALIERVRITDNGLTFNGDTAAANALDDYEEGTWTMGVSFGGASVGVTYFANTGTYTKIGRQVTVNGYIGLTSKGSSTGSASITGLPFTIPNLLQNYAAPSLWINNITFANQYNAVGSLNTTRISLEEVTELGVSSGLTDADFANNSELIVSFTYFV